MYLNCLSTTYSFLFLESRDFLHAPVLRGIQRRAETITSCDLLHCMRGRSSGYEDRTEDVCSIDEFEINEKNLIYLHERDNTEFQVCCCCCCFSSLISYNLVRC